MIGDLGQTADSEETVRHLDADRSLQIILHAGDMAYADTESRRWDSYGLKVEPLSSRLQWMCVRVITKLRVITTQERASRRTSHGSQCQRCSLQSRVRPRSRLAARVPGRGGRTQGLTALRRFFLVPTTGGNSFYAVDAGPARVISLNSYTDTGPQSAQYNWLKEELEALARRRAATPWLIVMMHCPFYSSNVAHQSESQAIEMRDAHGFEDLLHAHAAAVVISGHVHAYERTHPVYKNVTQPGAPTYIVVGDGGNREGHAKDYMPQPGWSAFRNGLDFGHGRLSIVNQTHMLWEWQTNDATQPPALNKEDAARRAAELEQAGATFNADSAWRMPLAQRSAYDSVWIHNPYRDPPPPRPRSANASLWAVGLVSAFAAALVLLVLIAQRCRRRPMEARDASANSAEMRSASSASSSRILLES